jgi:pSer/pThr/pTyr-binding forkhead associated (FHA) protein
MTPPVELVLTSGAMAGQRIPIDEEFVIGRDGDGELSLDEDPRVSRRHARIRVLGNGAAIVEDLGSGNGTFVNGTRIESERLLEDGDVVVIGTTVFELSVPPPEPDRGGDTISEPIASVRRVVSVEHEGVVTTLADDEELVIGREPECGIVVRSHEASRRHARISQVEGRWVLTDLGSLNGTYLNGERLNNESRWLTAGDSFSVGGEELSFDEAVLPV